jgi:uncharacterized protein YxeA
MKKAIGWIIALVVLAFAGFKVYSYWNTTYNGTTAYAIVQDSTKKKSKTSKNKDYKVDGQQYYYYEYDFKWITKDGKELDVSWNGPEGANPDRLTAGTYIRAEVSQKRVIKGPSSINKDQVPSDVLSKLQ